MCYDNGCVKYGLTNSGDGGDNFSELQLVQDGGLTSGIQSHCNTQNVKLLSKHNSEFIIIFTQMGYSTLHCYNIEQTIAVTQNLKEMKCDIFDWMVISTDGRQIMSGDAIELLLYN